MEGNQQEKLIIENLKEPITIEDIINHFKDCGPIDDVIIYNSDNFISAEIYFKDKLSISISFRSNLFFSGFSFLLSVLLSLSKLCSL